MGNGDSPLRDPGGSNPISPGVTLWGYQGELAICKFFPKKRRFESSKLKRRSVIKIYGYYAILQSLST